MIGSIQAKSNRGSVTKFENIKPVTVGRSIYTRSHVLGLKNYKVPLYDDLRYTVFTSLRGVTQIIFPKNMRIKSHKSGMDEYFEISPNNAALADESDSSFRYLFVRPIIPESIPASLNYKIQKNPNLLNRTSTQLHVILENENGEDVFVRMVLEISSKRNENETIEIVASIPEDFNSPKSTIKNLKKSILESMNREKRMMFDDFMVFNVGKTKHYNKQTTISLETITSSSEYYYYNCVISGNGLLPLSKEDIKLGVSYYKRGLFWEDRFNEGTLDASYIIVYPDSSESQIPEQRMDIKTNGYFQRKVTFAFKKGADNGFFYSTLNIKNSAVIFENKVFLKKSTEIYPEFLSDNAI